MNETVGDIIGDLPIDDSAFAVSLLLITFLFVFNQLRKNKLMVSLRRSAVFEKIKIMVDEAIESGQPIYLSLGLGATNSAGVVDSVVGLSVLEYINRRTAGFRQGNHATCGEVTLFTGARGMERSGESRSTYADRPRDYITFIGPDPLVYAVGIEQNLGWSDYQVNFLIGYTGTECLYIAGSPVARQTRHVGGASSPLAAALLYITTGDALIGEEFYAARFYLRRPADIKVLILQDWSRYILLFAIVVGVFLTVIGRGG